MFAPVTNNRLQWRTSAVASTSGPTIMPGVSTSVTIGRPNASHSCMNRAALSAPSESIAPARWVGLLAITPTGRPSSRASAVIMPDAESAAQFEHRIDVEHRVDRPMHVVGPQAIDRHRVASRLRVGAIQSAVGPWK